MFFECRERDSRTTVLLLYLSLYLSLLNTLLTLSSFSQLVIHKSLSLFLTKKKKMTPASLHHHISKKVCVMDASGRLGSTLVDRLIHLGYSVNAAIQNHGDLQAVNGLDCDKKNLRIFHSDPFDYQSIIDALKGCSALFYSFELPQDQSTFDEFMVDVEVRAAHNVLEACARTDTIEKVVFTSSVTAVIWRENRKSISDLDERNWSDVNFCRNFKLWHALSKTQAEKTAWALAMDRGVHMVSINAGFLVGPDVSIKSPYLKGAAEMYEDGVLVTVDLKVLVEAHICVLEDVSTYGRYLCFNNVINHPENALKFAQTLAPSSPSSTLQSCEDISVVQQRISNKKLNKVMVNLDEKVSNCATSSTSCVFLPEVQEQNCCV